ncbi:MAG: ferritin [Negativicutes bacterium]|nr:ferritin [Negativicutes bacterium]
MLNQRLEEAMNAHVTEEFYSAYLYYAMAKYAAAQGYPGAANWLMVQYQEETLHAHKIVDYIVERSGQVRLAAIPAPPREFGSLADLFDQVLEHERLISRKINELYGVALEEGDFAATIFLQWFVSEQVEEEASAAAVVDRMRLAQNRQEALLFIDSELAKRQFIPPAGLG